MKAHAWSLVSSSVADQMIDSVACIQVLDLNTLRRHFPALGPEELADRLVVGAVRCTEAVGGLERTAV
ncbi:hypothetical protein ACWEO4_46110 [Streptomyces sp. NPDC004393]